MALQETVAQAAISILIVVHRTTMFAILLNATAATTSPSLTFLTFLVGLTLAWLAMRFFSDLPRRLPVVLELIGTWLVRFVVRIGWYLLVLIFTRAVRTLQYLLTTNHARRWRYRLQTRLRALTSIFHLKS